MTSPADILGFWFDVIDPVKWWEKDTDFDQLIKDRFGAIYVQAFQCELFEWRQSAAGRLAEVIVLDQFSRNMFRDTPEAFAADPMALALAQEAVATGADLELDDQYRAFLYMPYMHSESLLIHEIAVQLFGQMEKRDNLEFELQHKVIIERFGRYPHRNKILGRRSTEEEEGFLQQPGSGF
ncbi:MAG: DUF924 family protein [Pseudomonadota bacterium]